MERRQFRDQLRGLPPTCYPPGQVVGALDLGLLVLDEADLAVALSSRRRGRRQKLEIFLSFPSLSGQRR